MFPVPHAEEAGSGGHLPSIKSPAADSICRAFAFLAIVNLPMCSAAVEPDIPGLLEFPSGAMPVQLCTISTTTTRESPNRAILLFALPMVLEALMESLFAMVDIFRVSRLSAHAIALVGLTESTMALIYAVAVGMAIAGLRCLAPVGQQGHERAAQVAIFKLGGTTATPGLMLGYFAVLVEGFFRGGPTLRSQSASDEASECCIAYGT